MSHESTITALKRLTNTGLEAMVPETLVPHIRQESDRAAIILYASLIENFVLEALKERMPSLNSDEKARIFGFEGPCGSFSSRLRMAHALNLIDRGTRKRLEVIKEMRNACAHANAEVTFDTPEISEAVMSFFDQRAREALKKAPGKLKRYIFEMLCKRAVVIVADPNRTTLDPDEVLKEVIERADAQLALRGKSQEASPQSRPGKAKKDKPPQSPR